MFKYQPGSELVYVGRRWRVLYCTEPETLRRVTHCIMTSLSGPAYTLYELVSLDNETEHKLAFENWINNDDLTGIPQD